MKVKLMKNILLVGALLACLISLRATELEVLPGEQEQAFSHTLSLEKTCLPAIWVMSYTTLIHSILPLFFRWKRTKKFYWTVTTLPVVFILFMPRILFKQTQLAMEIFCREYDKKTSFFAFLAELWQYNDWFMKAVAIYVILELLLYVCYFIAGNLKVSAEV